MQGQLWMCRGQGGRPQTDYSSPNHRMAQIQMKHELVLLVSCFDRYWVDGAIQTPRQLALEVLSDFHLTYPAERLHFVHSESGQPFSLTNKGIQEVVSVVYRASRSARRKAKRRRLRREQRCGTLSKDLQRARPK
ncbi:unnamed protein product [Ostreobium quekettii]|uniref:Uncharacterized protein n=1 Tax=Ostreobium quekettii TaxID=121088 RepID=A0A8S1J6H5_9CHLO|nr:unnamed protein product [Ostreobium quekettii]